MTNEKSNQLERLLASLPPVDCIIDDQTKAESLTYHRRGHWFKSSIAHHNLLPEDSLFFLNKSSDPQPG